MIKENEFIRRYQEMVDCPHKNAITFYSPEWAGFNIPVRLSLKDIVVTKGKIKFILEDGMSFYVEDKTIVRNIHTDKKKSSTNKYESFMGKKSILKHHSNSVKFLNGFTFGLAAKVDSCSINAKITECIHDDVTTFIINDDAVRDLTFPDYCERS